MRPRNAWQAVAAHLEAGERLLWVGKPRSSFRRRDVNRGLLLFAALLLTFGLVILVFSRFRNPVAYLFAIIGLGLIVHTAFGVGLKRRSMTFGLTDRRAIFVSGRKGNTVHSAPLSLFQQPAFSMGRDGFGTITAFTAGPFRMKPGKNVVAQRRPVFFAIAEPDRVFALLMAAKGELVVPPQVQWLLRPDRPEGI